MIGKCIFAIFVTVLHLSDQLMDDFLLIADQGSAGKIWQIGINDSQVIELPTGITSMSDVVYDSSDAIVYFTAINGGLYKFKLGKNETIETILKDISGSTSSHGMSYSKTNRTLYIATRASGIHTVDVDSYDMKEFYGVETTRIWDVSVDNHHGHIYWTQENPPAIYSLGHTSVSPRTVVSLNITSPKGLYVDGPASKIYWVDSSPALVMMANLDGTGRKSLVHIPGALYTITGVNQHLFVAGPDGRLYRVANCNYTEIPVHEDMSAWGLTGYSSSPYKPVCSKCCANGGSLDIDTCECSCTGFWKGDTCQECGLSCDKDGVLDEESCQCFCPYQWGGLTCSECTRTCSNGGILENTKCECRCPGLWSGVTCQDCNATCKNEGTLDEGKCSCACAGFWTGNLCDVCDGVCENGGTIDNSTCTCACPGLWRGNTCQVCLGNCFNGGTIYDITCKCNCNQPWRGDFCSEEVDGTTTVFESPPPTDTGLLTTPFIVLLAVSSSILLVLVISIIVIVVHNQKYRKQQSQKNNSPYEKGEVNYEYVEHPSDDNAGPKLCNQVQGAKTDDAEVYMELDTDAGYLKPVGSDYTSIH